MRGTSAEPSQAGAEDSFREDSELERRLGLFDATTIVAGLVIGSGIFLTTGTIARSLPDPGWILIVWAFGGLVSLAGALTFAEMGALMPRVGGQYVFLRESFGELAGFLFGWAYLLVIQSGSIAAVAVGFAEYFNYFFPSVERRVTAVSVILLLAWINYRGVRESSLLQNVFTSLKVLAILGIAAAGIWVLDLAATVPSSERAAVSLGTLPSWTGFGVAMVAVLWTFDGWNCVTFNAGEIRNPRRNLPLAMLIGTAVVTLCYLLVNYVYVATLPVAELQETVRVAERTVTRLFGADATVVVVLVVLVSTFGSINAMMLSAPRIYFAMSRDGLFFRQLARVHPIHGTPAGAIWVQGAWASLLALSGSYDQLFTMVMFALVGFYAATGVSLFVLRRKFPEAQRPMRTPGYPLTPLLFIAVMGLVLANTLWESPTESLWGLLLVASGVPVWLYWRRKRLTDRGDPGRA